MDFTEQTGRIFAEDSDGRLIAEITFPAENGTAVINHTFVDDSLRGQGIAGQLVKAAVSQIRKNGLRVKATCSYAVKWLESHPEEQDSL